MRVLKVVLGLLLGLPVVVLASLWLLYPPYSWGQKTTVVVETPTGTKTGSGVVEVRWRDGPDLFPDAPHLTSRTSGEAVVVDLGSGRYLFALITGADRLALRVFGEKPLPTSTNALIGSVKMARAQMGKGAITLQPGEYPLLVTFGDIADPASVRRVDPNNLSGVFGPGFTLKSITLEITDEPVTEGKVEQVLGWLEAVGRERAALIPYRKNDSSYKAIPSEVRSVSPSDFSTELYK